MKYLRRSPVPKRIPFYREIFPILSLLLFIISISARAESDKVSSGLRELLLSSRFKAGQKERFSVSISGDRGLLNKDYSPASTFKTYLALALLEQAGDKTKERVECSDKHIPSSPRGLDLRDALFYSSNEYFEKIFPDLGKEKLHSVLQKIGYLPKSKFSVSDWWTDMDGLKHGGRIRKTPEEIHGFWARIFQDGFGLSDRLVSDWKEVLVWSDCPDKKAVVYGKTGSWESSFWFQGSLHSKESKDYVIYTILQRGENASRTGTIRRFYELVGCEMPSLD